MLKSMADNYEHDFEDDRDILLKDSQIRRRYLHIFNKRRDDFKTDTEYDDYLEMVEQLIYNLVNGIDLEKTKTFIEKYRRENQNLIARNRVKKMDHDRIEAETVAITERERLGRLANLRLQDDVHEQNRRREKRQQEAEDLLRIQKGDEAVARLRKRKEKAQKKKRKKEAAVAAAEHQQEERDRLAFMPVRPTYPNPLPVPVSMGNVSADHRPEEKDAHFSEHQKLRAATAAGFRQRLVYQRALLEFEHSLIFEAMQQTTP